MTSTLGERAKALGFKSLVGMFHGHAHNRLCQTSHLGTYVDGTGKEDFEGCERFFSVSNDLAPALRHTSAFHRRQALAEFTRHRDNFEMYPNSSTFIVNNYKQALEILGGRPALTAAMKKLKMSSEKEFHVWLAEERDYLKDLKKVPAEETLQMEYYKKLVELQKAE